MEGDEAAEKPRDGAANIEESPAEEKTPLNGKQLSQTSVAFWLAQLTIIQGGVYRHLNHFFMPLAATCLPPQEDLG